MPYLPSETILIFLVIIAGFVSIGLALWVLITRLEVGLKEGYEEKIELEIDKLKLALREELKEDRHTLRSEMQIGISGIERDVKEADKRQRIMQSWIDRKSALEEKNG